MHTFYFFIGTEAELIKMTPTMELLRDKGVHFKIISSGQNDIANSVMLQFLKKKVDIYLTKKAVLQTPFGLISWFVSTLISGIKILRSEFKNKGQRKTWLIIHGDTVSTVLGAFLGRIFDLKIAHVEAGYKSPNLFHPFPEELDRTISSLCSDLLLCPYLSIGKTNNIFNKKSINIGFNTSIDSLYMALRMNTQSNLLLNLSKKKFFIFALHRQETLINRELFTKLINMLCEIDTDLYCVFALHHPTKKLLEDLQLLDKLKTNKKIVITPRLSYFEYIQVLNKSEFIITDGVGNQQETYYLGKPCLLLRYLTEGHEGLNHNAVLSMNDVSIIKEFINSYKKYQKQPVVYTKSPSQVIVDTLLKNN